MPKNVRVDAPAPAAKADITPSEVLDAAAKQLLMRLSPDVATALQEIAYGQTVPMWMVVCGLIQRCYDNGEYSAPSIDLVWLTTHEPLIRAFHETNCEVCGGSYIPRWPGQRTCTSPACGAKLARKLRDAELAAEAATKAGEPPARADGRAESEIVVTGDEPAGSH